MDYGAEQKANYVNSHTDCNCWPLNNFFIIFIFRKVQTQQRQTSMQMGLLFSWPSIYFFTLHLKT